VRANVQRELSRLERWEEPREPINERDSKWVVAALQKSAGPQVNRNMPIVIFFYDFDLKSIVA
jgi:hypothetical protein